MSFELIIPQFLEDLNALIEIPSIKDLSTSEKNKPFGDNIDKAFKRLETIATKMGFQVNNFDGYALDIRTKEDEDYIGVLAHIDVVQINYPQEWKSDPFKLEHRDNILYGRGVNDDKGPLLISLYVIKQLMDEGKLNKAVRLIVGGDEENDWQCVEHYFKHNPQPLMGFSPDGNFPVVNGEKGIFQFEIRMANEHQDEIISLNAPHTICDHVIYNGEHFYGTSALSRNPHRADNALFKIPNIPKEFKDITAKTIGLYEKDEEMGETSLALTHIQTTQDEIIYTLDYRYPRNMSYDRILEAIKPYNYIIQKHRAPLYVDPNSHLVKSCLKAYEEVTGEKGYTLTKGGASYARALKNGIAFGATFPDENPNPHMPNEHMSLESIKKVYQIYLKLLEDLCQ